MKSENGALLTKIAAIINFVFAGVIFLIGLIAFVGLSFYQEIPYNLILIVFLFSIILIVFGFLFMKSSKKMENPKTVKNGAIWAIVLGVLSMSWISGILSIIGGIIGLIDADKK